MATLLDRLAGVLGAASIVILLASPALADVPAHTSGTICFTPNFWCWARPPGLPGNPCYCATAEGNVQGQLG